VVASGAQAQQQQQQLLLVPAAMGRLFGGESDSRLAEIDVEVLGSHAVTSDPEVGTAFLMRQAGSLGGQHGDGVQHHQRAEPRQAARVRGRPGRAVQPAVPAGR
jgi:hypothetical protein